MVASREQGTSCWLVIIELGCFIGRTFAFSNSTCNDLVFNSYYIRRSCFRLLCLIQDAILKVTCGDLRHCVVVSLCPSVTACYDAESCSVVITIYDVLQHASPVRYEKSNSRKTAIGKKYYT